MEILRVEGELSRVCSDGAILQKRRSYGVRGNGRLAGERGGDETTRRVCVGFHGSTIDAFGQARERVAR